MCVCVCVRVRVWCVCKSTESPLPEGILRQGAYSVTPYYQSGAVMAQLLLYMLDETKDEERLAHVCVCVSASLSLARVHGDDH